MPRDLIPFMWTKKGLYLTGLLPEEQCSTVFQFIISGKVQMLRSRLISGKHCLYNGLSL